MRESQFELKQRRYCAVIAAGVAVAGTAAYSAYSASSSQQDALNAEAQKPQIVPYTPEDPSKAYDEYSTLSSTEMPALRQVATGDNTYNNTAYQDSLSKTDPSLLPGIALQGANAQKEEGIANKYLTGQLSNATTNQVTRSSAYQALTGGYSGSDAANANTARNLGLTSQNQQMLGATLQGEANSTVGSNLANDKAINPSFVTGDQLMLTPQQLLSRDDNNAAYQNAVLNQNANIKYQDNIYATQASDISPVSSGIVSGIGSLGSAYLGGAGGGGGSGGYSALSQYFNGSGIGGGGSANQITATPDGNGGYLYGIGG